MYNSSKSKNKTKKQTHTKKKPNKQTKKNHTLAKYERNSQMFRANSPGGKHTRVYTVLLLGLVQSGNWGEARDAKGESSSQRSVDHYSKNT